MAVERQLSRQTIFDGLSNIKFNNEAHAKQFYHITEQNWYQQYVKMSKSAFNKLTNKIKRGIEHGQYGKTDFSVLDDGWKRFLKPLQGANKKQRAKSEYQEAKEETPIGKEEKQKPVKQKPKYNAPYGKSYVKKTNPVSVTKREYEKEVKNAAADYTMPDF